MVHHVLLKNTTYNYFARNICTFQIWWTHTFT